jgi:hypothetical protein
MSEGMSAERTSSWHDDAPITEQQLDGLHSSLNTPFGPREAPFAPFAVRKLLAEVERLRARETLLNQRNAENATTAAEIERERDQLRARLDEIGETREEWGQKYSGGGYLTRVDSDWMHERWPIEQWAWDNTRHGAVVGKRTIIIVEDWQDIRSENLPKDRPADKEREVPDA